MVNIPKDKDNYTEHIVKGSALIFFMSVLTNIVGYLIRIFLARSLTPEDYGLIYTAISLLGILNIMRNLGFSDTLRKKIPEYIVKKSYIKIKSAMIFSFIVEFAYTLAIFLIIFIFAGYLSDNLFHSLRGIDVLILLAISGIVQVFYGVIQSAFQGLKKVRLYTTLDFFVYLLRFVFIVALIPFGILALPLSYLITSIIMTVVAVTIFRFRFSFIAKAKAVITKKFSKEILYFSTPIMIGFIASSIFSNVGTVLISLFVSLNEAALYQIALPLSNILLLVSGAITVVLLPLVSELYTKHKNETLSNMLGLLTKALFLVIIPLALVMIAFPENAIGMLFGETYLGATGALQILSIGAVFMSLNYILGYSIIGIGKPGLNTKISFVTMIINLMLDLALIPFIGMYGVAVSFLFSCIICFFILSYYVRKHIHVRIGWLNMAKIFFAGCVSLAIVFAIKTFMVMNPWVELIISAVIGIVFYTIFVLQTKSVTRDEIYLLKSINLPIPKNFIKVLEKLARK